METPINVPANTPINKQPRPKADKAAIDALNADKEKQKNTKQIVQK